MPPDVTQVIFPDVDEPSAVPNAAEVRLDADLDDTLVVTESPLVTEVDLTTQVGAIIGIKMDGFENDTANLIIGEEAETGYQ
ncbi:hypothetical protein HanRHA438_Chr17g0792121 [Helianthus annuus]|nr:hypothetical protein HanXRQr2_Chr03g0096101 [Helianthus annuus]KAJ0824410.1 hypothetical protein HanRHA438_Chr17g0792121 [Helianthus annuus]